MERHYLLKQNAISLQIIHIRMESDQVKSTSNTTQDAVQKKIKTLPIYNFSSLSIINSMQKSLANRFG